VRQALLEVLKKDLGFPKGLIAVEKKVEPLKRRLDVLCYHNLDGSPKPLLLIECKAEKIDQQAKDQVIGYNYYVKAPFIALVSRETNCTGWYNGKEYQFEEGIPTFYDLCQTL